MNMKTLMTLFRMGILPIQTITSLLIVACTPDNIQNEILPNSKVLMSDKELLEYMGYELNGMIERDKFYVIGDEVVSKQRLEDIRNESETRIQYNPNNTLYKEHQLITLDIATMFSSQIQEAADEWNKLYTDKTSNIQLKTSTSGSNAVEFIIELIPSDNSLSLSVEKPRKGVNGQLIYLKIGNNWNALMSNNQIKYLFMHALGHLVGFEHALDYGDDIPIDSTKYFFKDDLFRLDGLSP